MPPGKPGALSPRGKKRKGVGSLGEIGGEIGTVLFSPLLVLRYTRNRTFPFIRVPLIF